MIGILYAGQPGTVEAAVYTKTTAEDGSFSNPHRVEVASVCNGTGGAVTLTVKVLKVGGTARLVYSALSIAAGATTVLTALVGLSLADGDSIRALASAATSLDLVISGAVVPIATS